MKRLTIVQPGRRRWLINAGVAAAIVLLTGALIYVVLAPVGVLQHNEDALHAIKPRTEGLVEQQDRSSYKLLEYQDRQNQFYTNVCSDSLSQSDQASFDKHIKVQRELNAGSWKPAIQELTGFINTAALKIKDIKSQEPEAQALSWDYLQRGYCYCQMKDYDRGISDFSNAIRFDSNSDSSYYNRAQAYRLTGRAELANADLAAWQSLKSRNQQKLEMLNSKTSP